MTTHHCNGYNGDANASLALRIGGLFGILIAGAMGFSVSILSKGRWKTMVFLFRAFSSGVVISTAFMHVMADAEIALQNPCLGLSNFPWVNLVTLCSTLFTFIFEYTLEEYIHNAWLLRNTEEKTGIAIDSQEYRDNLELGHRKVVAYTIEAGIVFHSIFIGIGMGTSHDKSYLRSLTTAIVFHQAFEGISLGTAIMRADLNKIYIIVFGTLFSFMTPIGIFIGILLGNRYNVNSKASLALEGAFNSVSAGILIYNSLVDLIIPTFDKRADDGPKTKSITYIGMFLMIVGAALMAVIAKWA